LEGIKSSYFFQVILSLYNHNLIDHLLIRATGNIAAFINNNLLPCCVIDVVKSPGPKVRYYKGSGFNENKMRLVIYDIGQYLLSLLSSGEYNASDIFILAPTVKDGQVNKPTPVTELANLLLQNGYQYFRPAQEDAKIEPTMMEGKIVLSTFHQSKGLERKIVVVTCFSDDYFVYYNRHAVRSVCPNTLYVAATRAMERLIVVGEDTQGGQLSFLRNLDKSAHLEIIEIGKLKNNNNGKSKPVTKTVSVTNLIKFLPESITEKVVKLLKYKVIRQATKGVSLNGQIETGKNQYEEVSELTGVALPAMFEARTTQNISTMQQYCKIEFAKASINYPNANYTQFLKEVEFELDHFNITGFLRISTLYDAATTGFNNKASQIKKYDWISAESTEKIMQVLTGSLTGRTSFEVPIEVMMKWNENENLFTIKGRIDAVSDDNIWELKCVNQLDTSHFLQLAVYAWMTQCSYSNSDFLVVSNNKDIFANNRFGNRLLNMRTAEQVELTTSFYDLNTVVTLLVEQYLREDSKDTDEKFLKDNEIIRSKFFPKSKKKTTT